MARLAVCFAFLLRSASAGLTTDMMHSMKSTGCSMVKVPLICSGHSSSSSSGGASKCSGSDCCAASSCYNIPMSQFECKASRGPTKCVGAGTIPPSAGVCQCKYGSCSSAGVCPSSSLGGRLYETSEEDLEVTPEDFTMAFAGLGLSCFCVLFLSALFIARWRRRGQQAPAGSEALMMASDSEEAVNSTIE